MALALSLHNHRSEDVWVQPTLKLASELELSCLPAQDAFFHSPQCKDLHDVLMAARNNQPLQNSQAHMFPNDQRGLLSKPLLWRRYRQLPSIFHHLEFSMNLNEMCEFSLSELSYQYPKEMIPKGYTAQQYLEHLIFTDSNQRYPQGFSEKLKRLIQHELQLIEELQFADYFLTVWDIVRWAREQNILCQGRGSAANSVVCYMLGITSVNPEEFDLLFERFISKERGDPPDIDVDFEHERREEVIQYIYRRYGRSRAAMVANVITFRSKGALRTAGQALGVPERAVSQVAKILKTKHFRGKDLSEVMRFARKEFSQNEDLKLLLSDSFSWKKWAELSRRLIGFPRHIGIHSGGFIIVQDQIEALVAQEPATMIGRTVVQWCKEDIEGLGFFKIDVLCLGMLTAIRKCFAMVEQFYDQKLTLATVPANDPQTYQMIQRADTVGTFQIESRAQMSMLPRLKPKNLYDLVIEVAIIRPGPLQGGVVHPYLRRREGLEPVRYPNSKLKEILQKTLGIIIFQEQAMRVAIAVGDFTAGEADELRKNIGAWNVSGYERKLGPWLAKLRKGMQRNGLTEEFSEQLVGQLRGFCEYGFPESHAISFAMIAYVSSYLKCWYPAAFFASILNSHPMGFYSTHSLLQAARRDGVKILPLSLNYSGWDHSLEILEGESTPSLRLGFREVKGLKRQAVEALVSERQSAGEFSGLENFVRRVGVRRDDLTALAATDIFSEFGWQRKQALWKAESLPLKPLVENPEDDYFWKAEGPLERMNRDFSSFGTSLGEHPVGIFKREAWDFSLSINEITETKDYKRVASGEMITSFGMTVIKQAPPSAKGMVFITLEDEYGFINLVFSPPIYEKYFRQVELTSFLCVRGKMQKVGAGHSILVTHVYPDHRDVSSLLSLRDGKESLDSLKVRRYF